MKKIDVQLTKADSLADNFIKILRENIIADGKVHTAKLINDMFYRTDATTTGLEISIFTEDYLKYVDAGRRARGPVIKKNSGFPPVSAFLSYTNGDRQGAWAIAYKIYRDGIEPTNVLQRSIDQFYKTFEVPDEFVIELEKSVEDILRF